MVGVVVRYIAPEVESDTRYGVKADVFGLGVALHVMLTGAFPTSTGFKQQARIREQDIEDQGGYGPASHPHADREGARHNKAGPAG